MLSQADFAMSKISSNEKYGGDIIRKTIDYFCHLKQRPMDIETIMENDRDFCKLDEFDKLKWIARNHDDIYSPDYTDVLLCSNSITPMLFAFIAWRLVIDLLILDGSTLFSFEYSIEKLKLSNPGSK